MKELYLQEAFNSIPHVLELLDRSPISPTYGCFDREYWHYKAKDFPSGMYEELALSLAFVYANSFPDNPYFKNARIKDYVIAAIKFAAKHGHSNGSNDDYYYNEQALGSTAFSLYALSEAYLVLGLNDKKIVSFLKKRADFVIRARESGTLSNHHALSALALWNVHLISGEEHYKIASQKKIKQVLGWQSKEGWFKEYEGCDPGYLTFTISFLAKYLLKTGDWEVHEALSKAVDFCFWTIHPDGSYGGEYGSRNTFHVLPSGFEILSKHLPKAAYIRDLILKSLHDKTRSRIDDDRIFNHYVYDYLQAYSAHSETIPSEPRPNSFKHHFEEAGIFVYSNNSKFLISSLKKGGVFKVYDNQKLLFSDTGIILIDKNGTHLSSQMFDSKSNPEVGVDRLTVSCGFYKIKSWTPSPIKFLLFRTLNIFLGKLASGAIRKILQELLILGKKPSLAKLKRVITIRDQDINVEDTIQAPGVGIKNIYISTDFTSIYTATSQPYQSANLIQWVNLSSQAEELNKLGTISIIRSYKNYSTFAILTSYLI